MRITLENADRGPDADQEISDPTDQVRLLCKAIAHADESMGNEVRSLIELSYAVCDGKGEDAASALLSAAVALGFQLAATPEQMHIALDEMHALLVTDEAKHGGVS